jgi:septum formation protein
VRLTLASQSPRRRELLAALGFELDVRPANADESVHPGEDARTYVRRVAREKARAVPGELVLAADTAVVLDGEVLGKPAGDDDARRMLRALSGRAHEVLTAVCVRGPGGPPRRPAGGGGAEAPAVEREVLVASEVELAPLDDARVDWYVATGEPADKAGAYAVQGLAGAFVRAVRGSVTNVVGLPLDETLALLAAAGVPMPWERR